MTSFMTLLYHITSFVVNSSYIETGFTSHFPVLMYDKGKKKHFTWSYKILNVILIILMQ